MAVETIWKLRESAEVENVRQLSSELGVEPVLAELLVQRGVRTFAQARDFFRPDLSRLHDPFLMNDMDIAVERLNKALGRKERILVYGDYDVDGTTAVALVYKFLQQFSSNIDYYIPDRNEDGYGISRRGIDYASTTGVKLIIVLDCGIKAIDEIAYAKSKGIDFIVCDHHVPDEEMPCAVAILNPKRPDSTYPYPHLSGCGVGFKFMQAFAKVKGIPADQLYSLLDLVAVSIASDLVPNMGENRILSYHGLKQINHCASTGLRAIIQTCGLKEKEITINDIIFKIGPRINASGRIQQGKVAVDLLIENNLAKALAMSQQINEFNETRKDLDKSMTEEANKIVAELENLDEKRAIVIFNEKWHRGVIGIVASRLTEDYHRPAVVITCTGEIATGSARSVPGFDVYKAMEHCRHLLENFGGHTYAAGFSLRVENIPAFKELFEEYVAENIRPEQTDSTIDIEAILDFRDITRKFFNDLKKLSPHGPNNPKPIFCTYGVYDYGTSKVVGRRQEHIKLELVDNKSNNVINGIAFGQSQQARYIKSKQSFDICYTLEDNTYKHGEVQLQIESIRPKGK